MFTRVPLCWRVALISQLLLLRRRSCPGLPFERGHLLANYLKLSIAAQLSAVGVRPAVGHT